jgi:hypothetical protein
MAAGAFTAASTCLVNMCNRHAACLTPNSQQWLWVVPPAVGDNSVLSNVHGKVLTGVRARHLLDGTACQWPAMSPSLGGVCLERAHRGCSWLVVAADT